MQTFVQDNTSLTEAIERNQYIFPCSVDSSERRCSIIILHMLPPGLLGGRRRFERTAHVRRVHNATKNSKSRLPVRIHDCILVFMSCPLRSSHQDVKIPISLQANSCHSFGPSAWDLQVIGLQSFQYFKFPDNSMRPALPAR